MIVTFSGGTTQQRDWVNNAINECVYPLVVVPAHVTIEWVAAMPVTVDSRHPYMATHIDTPGPGGTYHVYIMDWADDPTNVNNSGLPHPADDIQDYYQQSVVHECGHIVCFETFDLGDTIFTATGLPTAPDVADACTCFFKLVNGARSYGTAAQWSEKSLAWGDEIRESVAEVFKVAFYGGRLIFGNRTNWKVDPTRWNKLMSHIPAPDTPGFPFGTAGPPTKTKTASCSLKLADLDLWGAGHIGAIYQAPPVTGYEYRWVGSPFYQDPGTGPFHEDADPPYDEPSATLKLLSSSGDASIVVTGQDDGRWKAVIDLAGDSATFQGGLRPVWLWLSADFELGRMAAKLTSDAAGNNVVFGHTFHCGPQPATLFTSEIDADQPVGLPRRTTITDWTFAAPGQSPPNSFTEHFTSADEVSVPWHTSDHLAPDPFYLFWHWDGTLHVGTRVTSTPNDGSGPFGDSYVSSLSPADNVGLSLAITMITDPDGESSHHHKLGWTTGGGGGEDSLDIPFLEHSSDESWQLAAVYVPGLIELPGLADVDAFGPYGPLDVVLSVRFDGYGASMEKVYGGTAVALTLPTADEWYFFNPITGAPMGVAPIDGGWFGRLAYTNDSGSGAAWPAGTTGVRYTGIWNTEPTSADQMPDVVFWTDTPASGLIGITSHFTANFSEGFFGVLYPSAFVGEPLLSWGPPPLAVGIPFQAKELLKYRGHDSIDLISNTPTQGPAPVPQNPNAPGLTLVSAGAPQGGARTRTRPLSGVQGEAAKLVLP